MKRFTQTHLHLLFILIGFFAFMGNQVVAQESTEDKKVHIKIHKDENGKVTEIDEEFEIDSELNIDEILKKYGIDKELGELGDAEEVEIIIRKKHDDDSEQHINIELEELHDTFNFWEEKAEKTALLGVYPTDLDEELKSETGASTGAYVTGVVENSGASKSGIEKGDVITRVGDYSVSNESELRKAILSYQPGEKVEVDYVRSGNKNSTSATLGETEPFRMHFDHFPKSEHYKEWSNKLHQFENDNKVQRPFLGVVLGAGSCGEVQKQEKSQGIEIGRVIENSTAASMGLKTGDVITSINGQTVNNISELTGELHKMEVGETVKVDYIRDESSASVEAPIKAREENFHFKQNFQFKGLGKDCEKMMKDLNCAQKSWQKCLEIDEKKMEEAMERLEEEMGKLGDAFKNIDVEMIAEEFENAFEHEAEEEVFKEFSIMISIEDAEEQEVEEINKVSNEGLSIDNSLEVEELTFSPNPNNGKFNLSFHMPEKGKTSIKIFDGNKKEVYKNTLNKFSGTYSDLIDISENPQGVYYLEVAQNGKALVKKLVIQ